LKPIKKKKVKIVLICGDIHGNKAKLQAFLSYHPTEGHLLLGDLVDSFRAPDEDIISCLQTAISSRAILLYGNHEFHYRPFAPFKCSGYRPSIKDNICCLLVESEDKWKIAWSDGIYIATHAGIHPKLCMYPNSAIQQADYLNKELQKYLISGNGDNPIFYIGSSRNGRHSYPGPLWLDHREDELANEWPQIFGHTPYGIATIKRNNPLNSPELNHWCLDNEHQKDWVCYNTNTHQTEFFNFTERN
jgi:hypothetical protein